MKIKEITKQHRRDFWAIYECEHCGYISDEKTGYDDNYFHTVGIPQMKCPKCEKKADKRYRPLQPKYPEGFQI